jgi:hypothetical protein
MMHRRIWLAGCSAAVLLMGAGSAAGDEAPVAGAVKAVDPAARTITVEARARGKAREVVIDVRPDTKIVRFVRSTDAQKPGVSEQSAQLEDIQPGWMVSVKTRHEGAREVAEHVRVVHEK